jgi:hypothetical protein
LQEGNVRAAADLFRAAVVAQTPAAWRFHNDPQNVASYNQGSDRFFILLRYCILLTDRFFEASHEDKASLHRVIADNTEPKIFRAVAVDTLSLLAWDQNKREKAAQLLRRGIFICESAGGAEDQDAMLRITPAVNHRVFLVTSSFQLRMKLGILNGSHRMDDEQVARIIWGPRMWEAGSPPIPRRTNFTPQCRNVPPHLLGRTFVGGQVCDACGRLWEQLGIPFMPSCAGCGRAYYCSRDCQIRHRPMHRPHCRRERDFRPEDILKLDFLTSRPDLNGELVRAIEPLGDRWVVEILSSGMRTSISRQNLEFIRPPT